MTDYPEAPIIAAEPNRTYPGAWSVTVQCPGCGGKHHHGIPAGEVGKPLRSHRAAHCGTALGRAVNGYLIVGQVPLT